MEASRLLCRLRGVWHSHWGDFKLKPAIRGSPVSQEWDCLSIPAEPDQVWGRQVQAMGSMALGSMELVSQPSRGTLISLQWEVFEVCAHGRHMGGLLHPWLDPGFELEANAKIRLSLDICLRQLPQFPHAHPGISGRTARDSEHSCVQACFCWFLSCTEGGVLSMERTQKYIRPPMCERQALPATQILPAVSWGKG